LPKLVQFLCRGTWATLSNPSADWPLQVPIDLREGPPNVTFFGAHQLEPNLFVIELAHVLVPMNSWH
jgi:hypothetical protein